MQDFEAETPQTTPAVEDNLSTAPTKSAFENPERREDFLDQLALTGRLVSACQRVGASIMEYEDYCLKDLDFKEEAVGYLVLRRIGKRSNKTQKKANKKKKPKTAKTASKTPDKARPAAESLTPPAKEVSTEAVEPFSSRPKPHSPSKPRILKEETGALRPRSLNNFNAPEFRRKFLGIMAELGVVYKACDQIGISSSSYYVYARENPEFAREVATFYFEREKIFY